MICDVIDKRLRTVICILDWTIFGLVLDWVCAHSQIRLHSRWSSGWRSRCGFRGWRPWFSHCSGPLTSLKEHLISLSFDGSYFPDSRSSLFHRNDLFLSWSNDELIRLWKIDVWKSLLATSHSSRGWRSWFSLSGMRFLKVKGNFLRVSSYLRLFDRCDMLLCLYFDSEFIRLGSDDKVLRASLAWLSKIL